MADNMFVFQNTANGKNLQVSASTFMPSQGKLACGRTDGSIILVPAVETIVLHLLDGGQELGRCQTKLVKDVLVAWLLHTGIDYLLTRLCLMAKRFKSCLNYHFFHVIHPFFTSAACLLTVVISDPV